MNVTSSILDGGDEGGGEGSLNNQTILAGMTLTTSFCHCILGFIGLGLNGFISYAIATIEELRSQTRYVLFLGMLTANILSYVNLFLEVVYFGLSPSKHNCQLLRALLGLPNVIFFANFLLVLIDNYVAITRNALHRAKFTIRNVAPCQIGFTVVVCALAKFLYIVGVVALDCSPSVSTRIFELTSLVVLIVPCVVLKIVIFIKTHDNNDVIPPQQQQPPMPAAQHDNIINSPSAAAAATEDEGIEMNNFKPEINASSDSSLSSTESAPPPSPPPRNQVDNDQEQKSCHASGEIRFHRAPTFDEAIGKRSGKETLRVILNVISLLIIYIPRMVFELCTLLCSQLYPVMEQDAQCLHFLEARPFFTEYTALHGIIQPLIFLSFCDQFWTAWKNRHN